MIRVRAFFTFLLLTTGLALPAQVVPRQVTVAAAADLQGALEEVRQALAMTQPDLKITLTFGSSGQFYAQLTQKAPFDVFLSADAEDARRLMAQGLGRPGSLFTYGVGRIVLWVPNASKLELDRLGLKAVLDPSIRHLAMGNPRHAPYGRAAEAALKSAGIWEQVQPKLVLGENIAQAAQFAQSGAAEAGILALSLAMGPDLAHRGRHWLVPAALHPQLEQGGLILRWAKDPKGAEQFRAFLLAPEGRAILARYGFK